MLQIRESDRKLGENTGADVEYNEGFVFR